MFLLEKTALYFLGKRDSSFVDSEDKKNIKNYWKSWFILGMLVDKALEDAFHSGNGEHLSLLLDASISAASQNIKEKAAQE